MLLLTILVNLITQTHNVLHSAITFKFFQALGIPALCIFNQFAKPSLASLALRLFLKWLLLFDDALFINGNQHTE